MIGMRMAKKSVDCKKNRWTYVSSLMAFDKVKIFFLFVVALTMFLAQGCAEEKSGSRLKSFILKEQKIETVVKLSSIYDKKMNWVCVLGPYMFRIYDESPQNHAINKFLQEIEYQPREFKWSLVMSKNDDFDIVKFNMSKKSYLFTGNASEKMIRFPENFEPTECSDFEQSAMFKTFFEDRVYFVFGRIK